MWNQCFHIRVWLEGSEMVTEPYQASYAVCYALVNGEPGKLLQQIAGDVAIFCSCPLPSEPSY